MQRATATQSLLLTCRRLWPPLFLFSAVCLSVCVSVCLCAWQRCSYVTGDVTASVNQVPRRTLLVVPDCRVNGRAAGLVGAESRTYIMRVHSGLTVAVLDRGLFDGPLSD